MNMLKSFLALIVFTFLAFPSAAFASDGVRVDFRDEGLDIRSDFRIDEEGMIEFRNEIGDDRFERKGDEFKVEGTIDSISGDTFTVNFIPITVDPTMVEDFEQEGELMVGAEVEAEGVVIDDFNFFAEEVMVVEAEVEED